MPKLTVLEELAAAIRSAASEAEANTPSRTVAEEFCESERELIEPFKDEWAIEKVAGLIRKHRGKIRRDNDPQLQLEGMLGFHHLPRKIVLKSGEKVARRDATIGHLREQRALLWKTRHPSLEELDHAIELMGKYAGDKPGITWVEVLELEAANPEKAAASEKRRAKRAGKKAKK